MKLTKAAQQVRNAARKKTRKLRIKRRNYLSTGSTLLNLAISDRVDGGYLPGKYYFLVGDSTSGKTFFSMTCFAEAVRNPRFKDYVFYYDNVEDGMLMDVPRLFGPGVEEKLHSPAVDEDGLPVYSSTVEEFYYHVDDAVDRAHKTGKSFIYVLDSMDGLDTDDDAKKFDEHKDAHRSGKEAKGSYGMSKAKKNSTGIRKVMAGLRATKSILIIISQTRANPNAQPWEPKKTRAGGHALRFYATCEIWTSLAGAVQKNVRGKKRKIGTNVSLKITKNRITGKLSEVDTAIYPSYGIDDIGSCVDFLAEEKWWKKSKSGMITALGTKAKREKIIRMCEDGKLPRLMEDVAKCWKNVQDSCALDRKARYQ